MTEPTRTTQWKPRIRRISLEFMGGEWADAYVDVRYLRWPDAKAIQEKQKNIEDSNQAIDGLIQAIKDNFVSGKNINTDGELVEMTTDDIEPIDMEALRTIFERLMGVPDPNA